MHLSLLLKQAEAFLVVLRAFSKARALIEEGEAAIRVSRDFLVLLVRRSYDDALLYHLVQIENFLMFKVVTFAPINCADALSACLSFECHRILVH